MSKMLRYNLFVETDVIDALKRIAKAKGTTVSEIIRYSITSHLKTLPPPPNAAPTPTTDGQPAASPCAPDL